jgi:hypothetical protein
MARFAPVQNSFTGGLLSRRLRGRDDLEAYHQGLRQALNGTILPHGGFMRRSGSVFVSAVKNRTATNALLPFDVAVDQQYMMEIGHQYIRYYANHGQVESSPGTPLETVTDYTGTVPQDLRTAQQVDVMYMVHPGGHPYKLSRTSLTSFTWTKVVWKDGNAPMQPSNITAITCTKTGAGPYTFTFSASPRSTALNTTDDVGRCIRFHDGVYEITSVTSSTVVVATELKALADPAGSSATPDWALGMFSNTDGPRAVIFFDGRLWYGGCKYAPDVIVGSVSDDYDNFFRGLAYGTTPTINEDDKSIVKRVQGKRLQTIQWLTGLDQYLVIGSTGGEFRMFSSDTGGTLTPNTCIIRGATYRGSAYAPTVTIDGQVMYVQQNRRELYELRYEVVKDNFSSRNLLLLAEDIPDSDVNGIGGIQRMAYQASPDSTIWMTHGDGSLIGLTYEPDQKVIGCAPSQIADKDVFVDDIAVIQNPSATANELWFLGTLEVNGSMEQYVCYVDKQYRPAMSYERATDDEKIRALDEAYFVDLGLKYDEPKLIESFTKATQGVFTSTAHGFLDGERIKLRAPQGPAEMDRLSAIVSDKTTDTFKLKNGAGSYIDTTDWADLGDVIDPSVTNMNSPLARKEITTVTGLDHLEGLEVAVLADGMVHPTKTVSGGEITLQRRASIIAVGLPYTYRGETQRFVGGAKMGTDQGRDTTIDHVAMILHNTMGGKVGVGNGLERDLEELQFRDGSSPMDQSPPLFTGTKKDIPVDGGWDVEATVYFENDQPLPMTVLAVCPRAQTNEG